MDQTLETANIQLRDALRHLDSFVELFASLHNFETARAIREDHEEFVWALAQSVMYDSRNFASAREHAVDSAIEVHEKYRRRRRLIVAFDEARACWLATCDQLMQRFGETPRAIVTAAIVLNFDPMAASNQQLHDQAMELARGTLDGAAALNGAPHGR